MATTTRLNLRRALSESIGDYLSFSTSADGNAAKNSLVANVLRNSPGGADEGGFEEFYFLAVSGGNNGEARRCSVYVPDATDGVTAIVQSTFTNQTASGDSFEAHRYDPELKHIALGIALRELARFSYVPIRNETLIIDNLLTNSDFETFSSGFTGWAEVGSPTVTAETSRIYHGSQSAKVVAGAAVGQLTQAPTVNISEVTGKTATFKKRVWTDGANRARLRLDWDGSNFANSDYHRGNSEWQLLSVSASVPTTATQVKAICEVAATRTAYFDAGWLAVGPVYRYTIPSSIIRGPFQVLQQYSEEFVDGTYLGFGNAWTPTEGRFLRLIGMGVLSLPTTNSGTTELGEPQLRLVIAYAKKALWELLLARSAAQNRENLLANVNLAEREVERISKDPSIRMRAMSAQRGQNTWHIEQSDSGKFLIFDVNRS